MSYILDSSAILAVLRKEKGAEKVEKALEQKPQPLMHTINHLEVRYKTKQLFPGERGEKCLIWLKSAPFTIVELITPQITDYAQHLKSNYHLSLADSIGLALAKFMNYPFLTADHHELEPISKTEKVKIEFIR